MMSNAASSDAIIISSFLVIVQHVHTPGTYTYYTIDGSCTCAASEPVWTQYFTQQEFEITPSACPAGQRQWKPLMFVANSDSASGSPSHQFLHFESIVRGEDATLSTAHWNGYETDPTVTVGCDAPTKDPTKNPTKQPTKDPITKQPIKHPIVDSIAKQACNEKVSLELPALTLHFIELEVCGTAEQISHMERAFQQAFEPQQLRIYVQLIDKACSGASASRRLLDAAAMSAKAFVSFDVAETKNKIHSTTPLSEDCDILTTALTKDMSNLKVQACKESTNTIAGLMAAHVNKVTGSDSCGALCGAGIIAAIAVLIAGVWYAVKCIRNRRKTEVYQDESSPDISSISESELSTSY